MILCISVLSVVISPFSFLILLIWFFSLCFLLSLANGLSILFIFSKNQLFSFVDFCYGLLCFFYFHLFLQFFMISFLILILRFFISSFSSCFRYRVRLFYFSPVSWGRLVFLWTFPLALLLQCPIGFGLEKEMATHSSILAWRISGMGEPGGLLSMGSYRVGDNWSNLAAAATAEEEWENTIFTAP